MELNLIKLKAGQNSNLLFLNIPMTEGRLAAFGLAGSAEDTVSESSCIPLRKFPLTPGTFNQRVKVSNS